MSHSIKVSDETKQAIDEFAAEREITPNQAADLLISRAISRRSALARYAEKLRDGDKQPKSKKKKAAKKASKKSTKKHTASWDEEKPEKKKRGRPRREAAPEPQVEELSLN